MRQLMSLCFFCFCLRCLIFLLGLIFFVFFGRVLGLVVFDLFLGRWVGG